MWFLARCLALSFPLFLSGSHNELPHPSPRPQASQREGIQSLTERDDWTTLHGGNREHHEQGK